MLLRWLISSIGLAAVKGEISAAVSRTGRRAMLYALVVLFWLIAFGFALATFTVWLAGHLGVIAATAIVAGSFAVIGLIIQVSLVLTARRKPSGGSPLADLAAPAVAGVAAGSGGILGSLAIVAIVGWLLGRQILRK